MAAPAQGAATGATDQAGSATKGGAVSGVQEKVKGATDGVLGTVENVGNKVTSGGQRLVDRIFPPDKRASFLAKLQAFVLANPKLSAFLGMNIALTGIPLGLFVLFSLTVFIFALVVSIVLGLLAAVLFTVLAVGAALVVVLPTVMFTTAAAIFFFLWGLGGYYILRWANGDKKETKENGEAPEGAAVGDTLNRITGGKLDGFMESARAENAKNEIKGYNDRFTKPDPQPNGHAKPEPEDSTEPSANATKPVDDTTKKATDASSGATKPATSAAGTAKGAVGGATGLAG